MGNLNGIYDLINGWNKIVASVSVFLYHLSVVASKHISYESCCFKKVTKLHIMLINVLS